MSVIPFQRKTIRIKKNENKIPNTQESEEPQLKKTTAVKSNLAYFHNFVGYRKDLPWEAVKLRSGIVLKIHAIRKKATTILKESEYHKETADALSEDILELASNWSDKIMYSELDSLALLNEYSKFKDVISRKVEFATGSKIDLSISH